MNWDWSAVSGYQSLAGTIWGAYTLTGTYDGSEFTMTRPPVHDEHIEVPAAQATPDQFATPCPEPAGGWRVVDASRATEDSMEQTFQAARRLEGYAGSWMDQSINPASRSRADDEDDEDAWKMNDPTQLIINIMVTGDTTVAEAELREIWGGALCVSRARHSKTELLHVLDEVLETPGLLSAGARRDHVELQVIYDDGSLQRELDDRFGAELVVVTPELRPTGAAETGAE